MEPLKHQKSPKQKKPQAILNKRKRSGLWEGYPGWSGAHTREQQASCGGTHQHSDPKLREDEAVGKEGVWHLSESAVRMRPEFLLFLRRARLSVYKS